MIGSKEKVLDDIARVAGGTVSVISGLSKNIREEIKTRIDEMGDRLDFVPREDFERLETLVKEQAKRIDALEKERGPKAKTTAKKPAAKKATPKKTPAKKK